MSNVEVADDIIAVIRLVIGQFTMKNVETESIEIPISVKLWRVPGVHELLASLGHYFNLYTILNPIYIWQNIIKNGDSDQSRGGFV